MHQTEEQIFHNLKYLGLFSGIGGFEYAAQQVGWEVVSWCEWDKTCQRVLNYHFPDAEGHGDITKTDFKKYANRIDVLGGGFPCQPYSLAGQRKGTDDERHLWPQMLRAIQEIQPVWVVGENVRGIVSWSAGLVFEQVQTDLEAEGYEVLTFVLPAASVNAPHKRERVWFVAYSNNKRGGSGYREVSEKNGEIPKRNENTKPCYANQFTSTNAKSIRRGEGYRKETYCSGWENSEYLTKGQKIWNWHSAISRTGVFTYTTGKGRKKRQQNRGWTHEKNYRARQNTCIKRLSRNEVITDSNNSHERSLCGTKTYRRREYSTYSVSCNPCGNGYIADTTQRNDWRSIRESPKRQKQQSGNLFKQRTIADTAGRRGGEILHKLQRKQSNGKIINPSSKQVDWSDFPTQPPVCTGDDGISGRLVDITFSKWRTETLKALGNAVVPQIPIRLFNVINQMHYETNH